MEALIGTGLQSSLNKKEQATPVPQYPSAPLGGAVQGKAGQGTGKASAVRAAEIQVPPSSPLQQYRLVVHWLYLAGKRRL